MEFSGEYISVVNMYGINECIGLIYLRNIARCNGLSEWSDSYQNINIHSENILLV